MPLRILSFLIRHAIADPEFRKKLLKDPGSIVVLYGMERIERGLLETIPPEERETEGDRRLVHKLMANQVSERFMVLPTSSDDPVLEGLIPIYIDQWHSGASLDKHGRTLKQGRAFGSGLHPSTYLCLDALEKNFAGTPAVLDVGTGTGILAIAAAKLGASHVLAIDVDESAVQIASSNVKINKLQEIITVEQGSIQQITELNFDLVLANLTRSVHLELLKDGMLDLLAPGGTLIQAGVRDQEQDEIRAAIESAQGVVLNTNADRGWVSFVIGPK
jgi:ribosomal protein L11 methyltransferase